MSFRFLSTSLIFISTAHAQMPSTLSEAMAGTAAVSAGAAVSGSAAKVDLKNVTKAVGKDSSEKGVGKAGELQPPPPPLGEYIYDPTGLRDPFFPDGLPQLVESSLGKANTGKSTGIVNEATIDMGVDPIIRYSLDTYKAIAIVWDTSQPKAMVQATNGSFYTIRIGTKIGKAGGKVAAIREREIVIAEPVTESGKQSYVYRKIELR